MARYYVYIVCFALHSRHVNSVQQLLQSPPASPRAVSPPLLRDTDARLSLLLPAALTAVTAHLPLLAINNNSTNKMHTSSSANSSSFYSAASFTRGGRAGAGNSNTGSTTAATATAWTAQGPAGTCADVARYTQHYSTYTHCRALWSPSTIHMRHSISCSMRHSITHLGQHFS
jgi:hypothetical protein